ncbi:MAG TPA: hypothetical protein EYQ66_13310 [Myxococcales bacterium]|nr:hypothetical protein [Myxococcales bacterium]
MASDLRARPKNFFANEFGPAPGAFLAGLPGSSGRGTREPRPAPFRPRRLPIPGDSLPGRRASNSGGWQWAASTGTDAQPYFRIVNATTQGQRWDPGGRYVRRWVPELRDVPDRSIHTPHAGESPAGYPQPSVDHAKRREVALDRFRQAQSIGARK